MACSESYFFVGVEAYSYVSMFDFRMVAQEAHCLNDFGYSGFIVSTEKCCAVGYDYIFAFVSE